MNNFKLERTKNNKFSSGTMSDNFIQRAADYVEIGQALKNNYITRQGLLMFALKTTNIPEIDGVTRERKQFHHVLPRQPARFWKHTGPSPTDIPAPPSRFNVPMQ